MKNLVTKFVTRCNLVLLSVILGNVDKAREILGKLDNIVPGSSYVKLRRANLERRSKEIPNACAIYEEAIAENADTQLLTFYSIKYAKFLSKVRRQVCLRKNLIPPVCFYDRFRQAFHLFFFSYRCFIDCEEFR